MSNITTKSINTTPVSYAHDMRELRRRYKRKQRKLHCSWISVFVIFYLLSLLMLLISSVKNNTRSEVVPAMSAHIVYVQDEVDEVDLLLSQADETLEYTEEVTEVVETAVVFSTQSSNISSVESDSTDNTRYYIPNLSLTSQEIQDIAALVFLESGTESYECQTAVASVIINRVVNTGATVHDVIYAKGQFSPAGRVASTLPSDISMAAIQDVLCNGTTLPQYVTYFRAGHYHNWGNRYKQYKQIDHTYFSYDSKIKEKLEQ